MPLLADIPILLAIQGDPTQIDRRKTFGAMLESRASHWCASESSRRIHSHLVCSWGKEGILMTIHS